LFDPVKDLAHGLTQFDTLSQVYVGTITQR
jgi:hypothetical protein